MQPDCVEGAKGNRKRKKSKSCRLFLVKQQWELCRLKNRGMDCIGLSSNLIMNCAIFFLNCPLPLLLYTAENLKIGHTIPVLTVPPKQSFVLRAKQEFLLKELKHLLGASVSAVIHSWNITESWLFELWVWGSKFTSYTQSYFWRARCKYAQMTRGS